MKVKFIIYIFAIASIVFAQTENVEIKNSADNPLITINDEGTAGSITLPSGGALGTPSNKLYNNSSDLYWSGNALVTGGTGIYSIGDFAQGGGDCVGPRIKRFYLIIR